MAADGKAIQKIVIEYREEQQSSGTGGNPVSLTYSDMPKSPNRDGSRMEDAIIKIIDLENEINQDMMKLVELKKDIIRRIKAVESAELQTILELRYLSYMRWEEIAIELGYGIDNVFRLHRNALDEITIPETIQ